MACFRPFWGNSPKFPKYLFRDVTKNGQSYSRRRENDISGNPRKISGFPVRISNLERIYNKTGSEISNPICQTFKIPGTSAVLIRWCIIVSIPFMACSFSRHSSGIESATNRSISLYRCSNSARLIVWRRAPVLVSSIIISVG